MYKAIIWTFLPLFLLSGCGGSESQSSQPESEQEVVVQNTAPIVSGDSQLQVKVLDELSFKLSATDKESDTITYTIDNQPQWLNATYSDGIITLNGKPDFLDIASYELSVIVSDGKLSTTHPLTVEVLDDQEKWSFIDVTQDDILGGWYSDEQDLAFTFIDSANGGAILLSEHLGGLSYEIADAIAISGYFYLPNYEPFEDIKLQVLAKNTKQLRVVMTQLEQVSSFTLHRMQPPKELHYTDKVKSEYHDLDPAQSDISLSLFTLNNGDARSSMEFTYYADQNYETGIAGKYDWQSGIFTSESPAYSFHSQESGAGLSSGMRDVFIDVDIKATILGVFNGHLFYTSQYKLSQASVSEGQALTPELEEELVQRTNQIHVYVEPILELEQIDMPDLNLGSMYTGLMFWNYSPSTQLLMDLPYGSTFEVTNEQIIKLNSHTIEPYEESSIEYKYTVEDNKLALANNGEVTQHRFYMMPSGSIGISSPIVYDNIFIEYLSLFTEVTDSYLQDDYYGKYQLISYGRGSSINIEQGYVVKSRGLEFKYNERHFIRWEDNGSVTVLQHGCPDAADFETCASYRDPLDSLDTPIYSNYKLIDKNEEYSLFIKSAQITNPSMSGVTHSIQRLKHK
ncbi:hypothetical protein PSECIP111951_00493 [Pseudoalteromonas holothuriae]|uniref:Cadherin domain-containing protein n=1 Tax=Pseudoalteromonas holothuriae TaxID=2963714 RepID=A0ABM9GF17_9GAMM|nr:cadherin repeat domain-containing protein [Pseudoalteromonas sp. CIP111951]CAH9051884.1 hypothetical protein PSECIP111951_00493 [Pseudoalteromonas sp. CIP111951]